jgi:hypothetical protein
VELIEKAKAAAFLLKHPEMATRHTALVKVITKHPHDPARLIAALADYFRHGGPEFIRLGDAIANAARNETELMAEQRAQGLKV